MSKIGNPVRTPTEEHAGILVKREDLFPGFPSGKLRGVIPYLRNLKSRGVRLVVNAGATHSNSHAIVSYAARETGLDAVTFVNSNRMHPAVAEAVEIGGVRAMLQQPMHLGPLKARAAKYAAENGGFALPWGLVSPEIMDHYAGAVAELPPTPGAVHVVPFGAGGWTGGVWLGLLQTGRLTETVVAVPSMPTKTDEKKLRTVLAVARPPGFGEGLEAYSRLPANVSTAGAITAETPWPSDPKYEWPAWGVALRLRAAGESVIFWSIGSLRAAGS